MNDESKNLDAEANNDIAVDDLQIEVEPSSHYPSLQSSDNK